MKPDHKKIWNEQFLVIKMGKILVLNKVFCSFLDGLSLFPWKLQEILWVIDSTGLEAGWRLRVKL